MGHKIKQSYNDLMTATKLMIVDDAPFIREVVRQIAEAKNIEVIGEAENGEEAVTMALKLKPDVILMDVVMPKKSGIEAAREIKEKMPQIKIIACSTVDQDAMVMKAIESGCSDFVPKPFEKEQLLRAILKSDSKKT